MGGSLWGVLTIVGPLLFAAVALFVIISNKRRNSPRDIARTEAATRDLHDQINAEDAAREQRKE